MQSVFRKNHERNPDTGMKDKKQKRKPRYKDGTTGTTERMINLQLSSFQVVQKSIFLLFNFGSRNSCREEILVVIITEFLGVVACLSYSRSFLCSEKK